MVDWKLSPSKISKLYDRQAGPNNNNNGAPYKIRTILEGPVAGDSANVWQGPVKMARKIIFGHQVNMAEHIVKLSKRESAPIMFTEEKARRLIHPYNDALIVVLKIANGRVFWVLVDMGSLMDTLFALAYQKMNIGWQC
ncbi:hypothetical protein PanWU01x14_315020 [Parasponia andersonii]|uniref:Aspartic peptidase domain containing protein n=1 Tax=Parasponia andersonii TaxID=3476 RepID=A0A2P5ANL7_PARAD|nr:hypothetical protein PanWU01x14_315020 [Parasponia andersonii]